MFHRVQAQFRLLARHLLHPQRLLPAQNRANLAKSSRRRKPFGSISPRNRLPRPQSKFPRLQPFTLPPRQQPLHLPQLPWLPRHLPPLRPRPKKPLLRLPRPRGRPLPRLVLRPLQLLPALPRPCALLQAVAWIWWTKFWRSPLLLSPFWSWSVRPPCEWEVTLLSLACLNKACHLH